MASNQTSNYGLSQWEAADQVKRTDFNADNAKVDAALAIRNCRIFVQSYVGDDNTTRTHTFPAQPYLVLITDSDSLMLLVPGMSHGYFTYGVAFQGSPTTTWTDCSVTLSVDPELSPVNIANRSTKTYFMMAFMHTDN